MRDFRDKDEMQQQIDDLKDLLRTTANAVESLAEVVASNCSDESDHTVAKSVEASVHEAHKRHHEFRSALMGIRAKRAMRYLNQVADMEGMCRTFPELECSLQPWDKEETDEKKEGTSEQGTGEAL